MTARLRIGLAAGLLVALLATGCTAASATPLPTPGTVDGGGGAPLAPAGTPVPSFIETRGMVSDVQAATAEQKAGGKLGTFRLEGAKVEGAVYQRAVVTVSKDTHLMEEKDGKPVEATFEALEFGELVSVRIVGPVMESDPVQATAAEVTILRRQPRN